LEYWRGKPTLKFKILEWKKVELMDATPEYWWSVTIQVNEEYRFKILVPLEVKPADFEGWIKENWERVWNLCRSIYSPILFNAPQFFDLHERVKRIEEKLKS